MPHTAATVTPPTAQGPRAVWASGDYAAVAREVIPTLGKAVAHAAGVRAGDRVLDVAAGTGNASLPAAQLGADVTACDITPELLDQGRREAARRGLRLAWVEGDATSLPFEDARFDVVMSCVGVMFAAHQAAAAAELARVCRPGGRVCLAAWTPAGFVGRMFAAMRPSMAPMPPGAPSPLAWGDPRHVARLLGDGFTRVTSSPRVLDVERFAHGREFREFFHHNYGPTLAIYQRIGDDPAAVRALDAALDALYDHGEGRAWEYTLTTGVRAG